MSGILVAATDPVISAKHIQAVPLIPPVVYSNALLPVGAMSSCTVRAHENQAMISSIRNQTLATAAEDDVCSVGHGDLIIQS